MAAGNDARRKAPRRGGPGAGDGRRSQIVQLAAMLFDQEGYYRASMERLAEEAGIAKPTLYHYFHSKEDILFEIHQQFIGPLIHKHETRLQTPMRPSQLVLEAMADILELMETHRGHVRVFFEHHRELNGDSRVETERQRARYQSLIEDAVAAGVRLGEFRPIDPRLTALALFGMCNWAYQWYRSDGGMEPRELAYFMWTLLMRGVGEANA